MGNSPFSKPTILPIATVVSPAYMSLGRGEKSLYQIAYDFFAITSGFQKGLDLCLQVRLIALHSIAIWCVRESIHRKV